MNTKNLLLVVCFTCFVFASSAFADDPTKTYDLEFEGGSLEQLVRVLNTAKVDVNIIMTPQARSSKAPGFRLRNVTTTDLYNVLRLAGNSETYPYILEQAGNSDGKGAGSIWAFRNLPSAATTAEPISVGQLMNDNKKRRLTIEKITTAIQHTVDAYYAAKNEKPNLPVSFQFHEDTHLLIVSGELQAVKLARQTVEELLKSI